MWVYWAGILVVVCWVGGVSPVYWAGILVVDCWVGAVYEGLGTKPGSIGMGVFQYVLKKMKYPREGWTFGGVCTCSFSWHFFKECESLGEGYGNCLTLNFPTKSNNISSRFYFFNIYFP